MSQLGLFGMAAAMASHAAERQRLVATNIANADTPGYRATDLADFATALGEAEGGTDRMRVTRPGHLEPGESSRAMTAVTRDAEPSPNGNTVSLEGEMTAAASIKQQHDMALSIYQAGRDIVRASLGRGR